MFLGNSTGITHPSAVRADLLVRGSWALWEVQMSRIPSSLKGGYIGEYYGGYSGGY